MRRDRQDAAGGSLARTLRALLQELPGLLGDRVELFALELGRAASALARVVAWFVAFAMLGITAWFACWAGVVVALVEAGWHWALALLPVVALNLAAAVLALGRVRRLLPRLSLPATRRHLIPRRHLAGATADAGTAGAQAAQAASAASPEPHATPP